MFGVARVTRALLPSLLLSPQKKLIHISSNAGSIATQTPAGRPPGRTHSRGAGERRGCQSSGEP